MDKEEVQREPKPAGPGRPEKPLKIDMEWDEAVRHALNAGKPEGRDEDGHSK